MTIPGSQPLFKYQQVVYYVQCPHPYSCPCTIIIKERMAYVLRRNLCWVEKGYLGLPFFAP